MINISSFAFTLDFLFFPLFLDLIQHWDWAVSFDEAGLVVGLDDVVAQALDGREIFLLGDVHTLDIVGDLAHVRAEREIAKGQLLEDAFQYADEPSTGGEVVSHRRHTGEQAFYEGFVVELISPYRSADDELAVTHLTFCSDVKSGQGSSTWVILGLSLFLAFAAGRAHGVEMEILAVLALEDVAGFGDGAVAG